MFVFKLSVWHFTISGMTSPVNDFAQHFPRPRSKIFQGCLWMHNFRTLLVSVLWKAFPCQGNTDRAFWVDSMKKCLLLLDMWLWMIWLKTQQTLFIRIHEFWLIFCLSILHFFRGFSRYKPEHPHLKATEVCRKSWLQLPPSLRWFPKQLLWSLSLLSLTSTTYAQADLADPMYK